MQISEQELRDMIRDAIARHGAGARAHDVPAIAAAGAQVASCGGHASHGMFAVVAGADGECIIEPAVRCNHCGFYKSLGH